MLRNTYFIIAGGASRNENEYEEEIKKLAFELQLNNRIIFKGFTDELPNLMSAVDILAFPSYKESFGNILLEAMALELPIVGSNSGAVPEIVVDGETGFLVEPKNFLKLAQKILLLINNRKLIKQMGLAGRKRVEDYFGFDSYIKKLENFYLKLI